MHRLLCVCLDGLGDEPLAELGHRTPLEAAETPVLDELARRGIQGLVHTVGPDVAPESDIAVFAIRGYDPHESHPGRGVLEAIGAGMDFRGGDLAHRVNFARAEGEQIVDGRVGRDLPSEDARALAREVNDELRLPGPTFEFRATVEHRGALVIRADEGTLSAQVTNTDPAYAKLGTLGVALETFEDKVAWAEPLEETEEARRAADLTNTFVRARILDASGVNARRRREGRLPANLVLTRDAGDHLPKLQPIRERFGPSWGCFVEMPVERGIALILGMGEVEAPAPAELGQRYSVWTALAAEALEGYDALYVHIKGLGRPCPRRPGPGQAGHHRDDRSGVLRRGAAPGGPVHDSGGGHRRPRHFVRPEGPHGRTGSSGGGRPRRPARRDRSLRGAGCRERLDRHHPGCGHRPQARSPDARVTQG